MIPVYDYRRDVANVIVHPEIRGRFMRMEPTPAGRMHSHDLGGEIFLVLEGQCEFLIEDERVTCGPGQLIYVEPRRKHTLHAVGTDPCVVYLSVTPHVEPTHTQYDEAYQRLPPRYGTFRGKNDPDPQAGTPTEELAAHYAAALGKLAELSQAAAEAQSQQAQALQAAIAGCNQPQLKQAVDDLWLRLRDVLQQTSDVETAWNALAPRAMPPRD
jgi:quercetin dioxygenase-like cupin family protein